MLKSEGGNFEKEFEATLMSTFSVEDESNNGGSPVIPRALTRHPNNARSLRDRSNSLYTIGLPQKQQQLNFLTTPIFESTENLDEDGPTPSASVPILQNTVTPIKKLRRLNTLLLEALKSREVAEIERLILAGANPNATCSVEHISACHIAAMRPDGALAMLIYHGVEKNRPDRSGRTPLHLAAWAGQLRQMAMLLGFSKELIDEVSRDISYEVAAKIRNLSKLINDLVNVKCSYSKNEETIPKEWLDNMTDHDCKEFEKTLPQLPSGWTPLHAASSRAKSDCCRLLLIAGADPSIRDLVGRSPLDIVGSTFYTEENIDPQSFAQIVSMLAGQQNSITINKRKTLDTPLHTAVELNSIDAVKILLGIHIPLTWLNKAGLTPLHICVKNKYREMLQMLVNNRIAIDNETKLLPAVDVIDKDGNTVLHYAVLENWEVGVCVALEAEANVAVKNNNGDTALHLAAENGNIEILNEILTAAHCDNIINVQNSQKESPLMKAVRNGHTKCVRRLLEEKASVKILLDHQVNVFHIAAEKGYADILQVLLDDDYTVTRAMINYLTENEDGFGPIHYAVQNNHLICVKLLLSRNAFRSLKTSLTGKHDGSTPLHLAAKYNHVDIAKVIIKNNTETLDITNSQDWTALHTASYYGSRDVIVLLLKEGANLAHIATGINKKEKNTSLDLIMNNITKPTEFLKSIFDDYISTNDCNIQDPNCKVTVNYQALVPKSEGKEQMKVIEALLKTGDRHGQRNLLVHPLLESFLHLKWRALLPFFYSMIIAYGVYVALLTIYVLAVFSKTDGNAILEWINPQTLAVVLYVTCFFVVALEALYVHIHYMYFLQIETWIKFGSIMLALSLPNSIATTNGEQEEYPRHIATISLLMCWLEMMFLLSRFPKWGYYVLMFGKVCCTVLKILLTFAFLLMGFSLSFMIQFHHNDTFHDTFASIVKVLVMMTSEFDYGNLIDDEKFKGSTSVLQPVTVFRCMFLLFLIITAIVLMNLMVGVAVNDLHYLQVLGNVRRLTKQVEFLVSFDRLLYNRYVRIVLPKSLEKLILKRKTILNVVALRPSDTKSEYYKKLPSEIREAIFETAQSRINQMEDEMGSQTYKKKLDEIHEATVKKKPKKEEPPTNTTKFINFDITTRLGNDTKKVVDLDSGILDGDNKNMDETIMELKSSITILEMKMDMILNRLMR